jgi:hypothetical protein
MSTTNNIRFEKINIYLLCILLLIFLIFTSTLYGTKNNEILLQPRKIIIDNLQYLHINNDGNVLAYNKENKEILKFQTPIKPDENISASYTDDIKYIEWPNTGENILLWNKNNINLLNINTNTIHPLKDSLSSAEFSPDGKSMIYQLLDNRTNISETRILNLETYQDSPYLQINVSDQPETGGSVKFIWLNDLILYATEISDQSGSEFWKLQSGDPIERKLENTSIEDVYEIKKSPSGKKVLLIAEYWTDDFEIEYHYEIFTSNEDHIQTKINRSNTICDWIDDNQLLCIKNETNIQQVGIVNLNNGKYNKLALLSDVFIKDINQMHYFKDQEKIIYTSNDSVYIIDLEKNEKE